ncbi:hypothetical protein BELL_1228g00030 [Botrytis elliptica]|uniref:Uncharacterized protein n=1 Tax=Botrytis elliptica TaxID=278938 RepID=A0A4Z1ISU2_9HELO|nr:hypothetical protein BELL_1228g00030 [Botrytis elliptica]
MNGGVKLPMIYRLLHEMAVNFPEITIPRKFAVTSMYIMNSRQKHRTYTALSGHKDKQIDSKSIVTTVFSTSGKVFEDTNCITPSNDMNRRLANI